MAIDPYVFELIRPEGYGGHVSERQYANDYYGDFFNYTRTKNPEVRYRSCEARRLAESDSNLHSLTNG